MRRSRLFIAISLPLQIKDAIYEQVKILKQKYSGISWVDKEKLHITLKYLGSLSKKLETYDLKRKILIREMNLFYKAYQKLKFLLHFKILYAKICLDPSARGMGLC